MSLSLAGAAASNQVNVQVNPRQVETGTALAEAQQVSVPDGDSHDVAPMESNPVGALAQAALQAGLLGLPHLLPDWVSDAKLIGYTIADDHSYEATYVPTDIGDSELGLISEQINEHLETTLLDVKSNQWLLATVAADDVGGRVGALAVLITPNAGAHTPDDEDLVAAVELAAGAYARLLLDLLGEQPLPSDGAYRSKDGR